MLSINLITELCVGTTVFLLVFYLLYKFTVQNTAANTIPKKIWFIIIFAKLLAAIFFTFIHYTKYKYSDTLMYHEFSVYLNQWKEPSYVNRIIDLLTNRGAGLIQHMKELGFPMTFRDNYAVFPQSLLVFFNSLLNFIFFESIYAKAIVYSAIAFLGLFKLFQFFSKKFSSIPPIYWLIPCFVYPSVMFWSSGILKEPFVFLAIGLTVYYFEKVFINKEYSVINFLALMVGIVFAFSIKAFVFMLLLITLSLYYMLEKIYKLPFTRRNIIKVTVPFILVQIAVLWIFNLPIFQDYRIDKVIHTSNTLLSNIQKSTSKAGSLYHTPFLPNSVSDLLALIPFSFNIVLFRPYFWESNSLLLLLAAAESILMLIFVAWVIWKSISNKNIKQVLSHPFWVACLVLCIIFFLFIAITSGNFGTLTRYKTLFMPFFIALLVWLWKANNDNTKA